MQKYANVLRFCLLLVLLDFGNAYSAVTQEQGNQPNKTSQGPIIKGDVLKTIEQSGSVDPEWWDSVPLNYPKSLELNWPQPKKGSPWNTNKNIGQYVWSVINENPGRWRGGAKFMMHVYTVNENNDDAREKAISSLGHIFADLLGDYARGAYWWQKVKKKNFQHVLGLANCYWQLGSKELAEKALGRISSDTSRYGSAIKLWSDLGNLKKAVQLAKSSASKSRGDGVYLALGNAYRREKQYKQAISYFDKVLAIPLKNPKDEILKRNHSRAKSAIEMIKTFEQLDLKRIPDGRYQGNCLSYAGDLRVEVVIKDQAITALKVLQHKDKQFFSALQDTPRRIIARQSLQGVDTTTGATITSEAIINAAARALATASK